jgi:diphthamide synthase (EF-2-diphthine--ammonia ligase)
VTARPAPARPAPAPERPGRVRAWVSWSTGKDSAYALHLVRSGRQVEIAGLFTTINADAGTVAYNGVPLSLARAQAHALGLPLHLLPVPAGCPPPARETLRRQVLAREAVPADVKVIIFGDAAGADIRASRAARLAGLGIGAAFPLWGMDTRQLARMILDAGIHAVITRAAPRMLGSWWVGKPFSEELITALGSEADPCGENGEYDTFTCDSPDFRHPIPIEVGGVTWRDGSAYADLVPASAGQHRP